VGIIHQNPQKSVAEILGNNSFQLAKGGLADEDIHSDFVGFEV